MTLKEKAFEKYLDLHSDDTKIVGQAIFDAGWDACLKEVKKNIIYQCECCNIDDILNGGRSGCVNFVVSLKNHCEKQKECDDEEPYKSGYV